VKNPSPRLATWLQLFRAPNLFTVPGDPLAGYLLANSGFIDHTLVFVILASVAFYAAGLLQNDLADFREDTAERPNRPLPSGAAEPRKVRAVMWALNVAGLALCAATGALRVLAIGAAIILAVTSYNRASKKLPVIGALNMGLCRGLSVALGGAAGSIAAWQLSIMPLVIIGLFIAAVTNLARHETRQRVPALARILPAVVVLLGGIGAMLFASSAPAFAPANVFFVVALVVVIWLAIRGFRGAPLPPLIGGHIRILLLLQAGFCYLGDPWGLGRYAALALVALWPVSALVSRRFYAS
jgi:4-hydroxybenzoate polyprenyltransferase